MSDALRIDDLGVRYGGTPSVVTGVSLHVGAGELVGLIGESGCGKSTIASAILGLLPPTASVTASRLDAAGHSLLGLDEREYAALRGRVLSIVFQDPLSALNPTQRIGRQIAEGLRLHGLAGRREANARALELLRLVQVPDPELRMRQYPHQLSGGLRQRVAIAMAMAAGPSLLVADEPTTALDATVQAQILAMLDELRRTTGTGVLLISHDLGVIAEHCDRVLVMYAGQIVEQGTPAEVLGHPTHPYTRGLIASAPRIDGPARAELPTIAGAMVEADRTLAGCRFERRCPFAVDGCSAPQALRQIRAEHEVRCLRAEEPVLAELTS
ncbi:ABC transporter ATP-binding protein [soil metagenome]